MSEERKIYVKPIQNGTVLDHLKPGTALKILQVLDIKENRTAMAMNVESKKMGRKDIVFIEGRELTEAEINKIALLGKGGTLNIVKNAKIKKKEQIECPKFVEGIVKCINPNCITNKEKIKAKLYIINKDPLKAKCYYCETKMNDDEIASLII